MRFGKIALVVGVAVRKAKATLLMFAVAGAVLAVAAACGGGDEKASTPASTQPGAAALVSHKPGAAHASQPKRLEAVIEIDLNEEGKQQYFANPQGEKNPTFRLQAGKTVGIHIHNEGGLTHELAIGRKIQAGEYQEVLTELVPSDLFFYYGDVKAEVEGAEFGEIEVDKGVRDVWMRINIPAELKGQWEIGCFIEGHYEAGMHASLTVE